MVRRDRPPTDPTEAHERFDHEFEKLQFESERLSKIERTPENFEKLAAGHLRVTEIQNRATDAKRDIVTRYEGRGSDWVSSHPGGPGDTSRAGKVGAIIAMVVLLAGGIGGATWAIGRWNSSAPQALAVVDERVEIEARESGEFCIWRFDIVVENPTDARVEVRGARVVLERRFVTAARPNDIAIEPGQQALVPSSVTLGRVDSPAFGGTCPTVDAIDHGPATVAPFNASLNF